MTLYIKTTLLSELKTKEISRKEVESDIRSILMQTEIRP